MFLFVCQSVRFTVPSLDSKMGWTGDFWSKTNLLKQQNLEDTTLMTIYFYYTKKDLKKGFLKKKKLSCFMYFFVVFFTYLTTEPQKLTQKGKNCLQSPPQELELGPRAGPTFQCEYKMVEFMPSNGQWRFLSGSQGTQTRLPRNTLEFKRYFH